MANDMGNHFNEKSVLNPEVVNGVYYGPMIITHLYAMYKNVLVHKVMDSNERLLIIKFFLRFVNNSNVTNTMMNVHGTWNAIFNRETPKHFYDCQGVEIIIGCTQVILGFYNSLLSIEMERIGQQVVGITAQNQLKVLGEKQYLSLLLKPLTFNPSHDFIF